MFNFKNMTTSLLVFILAASLTACAGKQTKPSSQAYKKLDIYEVHHDGRINVFYDKKLYKEFMQLGETSFRLTKIGAGPNGETIVYGLTKKDKKLKKPVPAIELYEGRLNNDAIYAEMRKHNRIYVFNSFKDMKTVRAYGHPNYMYTQIGAGPKGETIVFVLNSKNKKKRPDALISEFKKHNS